MLILMTRTIVQQHGRHGTRKIVELHCKPRSVGVAVSKRALEASRDGSRPISPDVKPVKEPLGRNRSLNRCFRSPSFPCSSLSIQLSILAINT
jgi:hypothetical protein